MTGTVVAASGNGGSCDRPEVRLPADTPTGQYRLEIDVLAVSEAGARLSDAVSLPMVVVDTMGGRPR